MEKFTISLVAAQLRKGYKVVVLCNWSDCPLTDKNLRIIQFKYKPVLPRWREAIEFGNNCLGWLKKNKTNQSRIVHSHERTWFHDLATFHGQTYRSDRKNRTLDYFSLRHRINYWLEAKLVNCPSSQGVIPVSNQIGQQLCERYGNDDNKILPPINPGADVSTKHVSPRMLRNKKPVIGFIGKEWKRKGLIFALSVFKRYLDQIGEIEMQIIGPDPTEIQKYIPSSIARKVNLSGWQEDISGMYDNIDILLHPASSEPYGMVIVEAMSRNIPVVVSTSCGAGENISLDNGRVLSLLEGPEIWAEQIDEMIRVGCQGKAYSRSWSTVADDYDAAYQKLMSYKKSININQFRIFPDKLFLDLFRGKWRPSTLD